jgi:hypothetical protein
LIARPTTESAGGFIERGFKKWADAKSRMDAHEKSGNHRLACQKISALKEKPVTQLMDEGFRKQQLNARKYLNIIISCVKYLAQMGLPFRGHEHQDGALYNLVRERIECDNPELRIYLEKRDNWLSDTVQNEIIEMMAHAVLRMIVADISASEYIGLVADGTTDISGKEQFAICIQYVHENAIKSKFIGMYNSPDSTGKTLAEVIKDSLLRSAIQLEKVTGFAFDGASNMSGAFNGAQAYMKKFCPGSLYIHCSNHCLDLVLQEAARENETMARAIQFARDVSNLVNDSSKRKEKFKALFIDTEEHPVTLASLCPTRWCVRAKSIGRVLSSYKQVLEMLEFLSADRSTRGETRSKAGGLYKSALKKNTYFALKSAHLIFKECETTAKILQSEQITAAGAAEAIGLLKNTIVRMRSGDMITTIEQSTERIAEELNLLEESSRQLKTPAKIRHDGTSKADEVLSHSLARRATVLEVLDLMSSVLDRRFAQEDLEVARNREKLLTCEVADGDSDVLEGLIQRAKLPDSFHKGKLKRQLVNLFELRSQNESVAYDKIAPVTATTNLLNGLDPVVRSLFSEV